MAQRTVMIGGGAGGMGLATALRFAQDGARLVLADLPGVRVDEAEAQVKAAGAEVPAVALDIAAFEDAYGKVAAFAPQALVLSLGVDTFREDPVSLFRLDSSNFIEIGSRIAALGLPTSFVMEGGYAVGGLGVDAVNMLAGFEEASSK